jgi:hypothetical protein
VWVRREGKLYLRAACISGDAGAGRGEGGGGVGGGEEEVRLGAACDGGEGGLSRSEGVERKALLKEVLAAAAAWSEEERAAVLSLLALLVHKYKHLLRRRMCPRRRACRLSMRALGACLLRVLRAATRSHPQMQVATRSTPAEGVRGER